MSPVKKNAPRRTPSLTSEMQRLQESSWALAHASSEKDLLTRLLKAATGQFPDARVSLFLRKDAGTGWTALPGESGTDADHGLPVPAPGEQHAIRQTEDGRQLRMSHLLGDGSCIGVRIDHTGVRGHEADVQASMLAGLLQAFALAHKQVQGRQNEKSLLFSLNHRVLQLTSLIDTGIEVAKFSDELRPEFLALQRAASLTNAARGMLQIVEKDGTEEIVVFPDGSSKTVQGGDQNNIRSSFEVLGRKFTFELYEKESRTGIQPFDETDQMLLDALARQVHAALENRHLHQQALEKQKIERDFALAAEIQNRLLPAVLPEIPGYEIAGRNIPSKWVGGDYYDCITLPDGRFVFVIADVAGKGISAALLVSSFHAFLAAYLEASIPLEEIAQRLNKVIHQAATDDRFVTAFFGLLTPETGEFIALNAGHNPVYILDQQGAVREIVAGGLPIGMIDMEMTFSTERVVLEHGDRLLLYTDGIPEAANAESQFFENHTPLKELFLEHKSARAKEFIDLLIAEIKAFTGTAPQTDDITLLYAIRK